MPGLGEHFEGDGDVLYLGGGFSLENLSKYTLHTGEFYFM